MVTEGVVDYKKTVCPLDCPDSCGIIAKVVDGRVVSLAGDPEHGYTRGVICRKMRGYPARVYGPERLLYPQVRVGKKGEGVFERISWEEALALFAEKIRTVTAQYGGEAILPFQYAGNMGVVNRNAGYALYHKLGTSRLIETICSTAAGKAWEMHLGDVPGSPPETAADARLIVAWGINVRVSNMHFWPYIAAARKKGAKLLVIDPYRNETAALADTYVQVAPCGDSALALGILKHLLLSENLDLDAIERNSTGFGTLASYLHELSWEKITAESGVNRETIESLAVLLADNPQTFIRIGIGLTRNSRGGMAVRSIVSLAAALGLFDGGTGRGVLLASKAFSGDSATLRFPDLAPKISRQVNMAHLGQALTALEPPVKLLSVYSSNPLTVAPDASIVQRGLLREDLFTVVHEQVMTPTARYADLLLPATTFLENKDLYTAYGHFHMGSVDRVIQPLGEAKSNFDLFQALATELGFTDAPFLQSVEERLYSFAQTLSGIPDTFNYDPMAPAMFVESTRKRIAGSIREVFDHPFTFYADVGQNTPSIACVTEAAEFSDPDLISRFPLKLITPPHNSLLNSTFGEQFKGMIGNVLVHPVDAKEHKIRDGSRVVLENGRGVAERVAEITEDVQQGLLVAEGLYWQRSPDAGGINALTSQKTTDVGAGPTFHESRVAIRPAADHKNNS